MVFPIQESAVVFLDLTSRRYCENSDNYFQFLAEPPKGQMTTP